METHAERMVKDATWVMRWVWYKRIGTPPISFEEFTPYELTPFLVGMDQVCERQSEGLSSKRWGPPRELKLPARWDEAIKTGDKLIDKWEREIASGRTPDLAEGLSS